jgi:hypothetical protein
LAVIPPESATAMATPTKNKMKIVQGLLISAFSLLKFSGFQNRKLQLALVQNNKKNRSHINLKYIAEPKAVRLGLKPIEFTFPSPY